MKEEGSMSTVQDLILHSSDGVFGIDSDQTVVFWNRACESMTGIPAEQAVGSHCHDLLRGRDLMGRPFCRCDCPLSSLANGGPPPSQVPMRITRTDGQNLQLSVGTMLIPSSRQQQWNVVHVMRRGRESNTERLFDREGSEVGPQSPVQPRDLPGEPAACLLTGREREILRLLANGTAVEPMSHQLHISVTTVRNHIQRLMAKLEVHSRVEAVAYAYRHQLI
jgi:DNA-binding CsgD family transcriptional regulator